MRPTSGFLALAVASALPSVGLAAPTQYTIVGLNTPAVTATMAFGINNSGVVAGTGRFTPSSQFHALTYSDGNVTEFTWPPQIYSSQMEAINDAGVGVGWVKGDEVPAHAALFANGTTTDLGSLGGESWAFGINNGGQIVGYTTIGVTPKPMIYENGQMRFLGSLPANEGGMALDINKHGVAVGTFYGSHAFMTDASGNLVDIGTLEGSPFSFAFAINDNGQIVGEAREAGTSFTHGFLYQNGQMIDLGTLGGNQSNAYDIGNDGTIVGYSTRFGATIWSEGVGYDLRSLLVDPTGWDLQQAWAINDAGWITGRGVRNGVLEAFLVKPVPEPFVAPSLLVVFALLARRRGPRLMSSARPTSPVFN